MKRPQNRSTAVTSFFLYSSSWTVTCQAQVDLAQTVSFGDSVTDNDLLYLLFPGTDPSFYGLDPVEAVF